MSYVISRHLAPHTQTVKACKAAIMLLPCELACAPSVEHEQEALAAAGLGGLQRPLLGALRQRVVPPARWPVPAHLLFQAHVSQLLHENLLSREGCTTAGLVKRSKSRCTVYTVKYTQPRDSDPDLTKTFIPGSVQCG